MSDKEKNNNQDQPAKQANFPTISLPDSSAVVGGEIGPYKLLSVLGEGGFGIVYLADQKHPVKRTVALKIIKPGMDTKQVIARFEAERQALALLEHPNIAHVFTAGSTETGRPYFVMEYIQGMPITEYCDHHKLSIKERLKLFIPVCEAVQHAHQKGIIHRDIKPSNIVVTTQDGKAIPKIIDFGVAKAISMPLTEKTMFTEQGQLIGTPEYMSPEQADLREKDIDTRTDIYSLGIVLYELLAGTLPFEPKTLREGGYAEIQRIIREQEPPRPSTKLSSLGENAAKVAQTRHIELSALVKSLHKELEWIPLMAIRKDRDQRYKTASDLAEDIQHYLDGNPLTAGPESAVYRFIKFIKKRKGLVATIGTIVTIILVSLFVISSMYIRAKNSEKKARNSERIALAAQKEALKAKANAENAEKRAQEQYQFAQKEAKRAEEQSRAYLKALYASQIGLASVHFQQNSFESARRMLDSCPAHLRGWEWKWLRSSLHQENMTLLGHGDMVTSVSFSPDLRRIASVGNDFNLIIWNKENGQSLGRFRGFSGTPVSVMFSSDSKEILTGSYDGYARIYDVYTGDIVKEFYSGRNNGTFSAKYSPDNKYITVKNMNDIIIWEVETGLNVCSLPNSMEWQCEISSDGQKAALTDKNNKSIQIKDIKSGEILYECKDINSGVSALAFSLDDLNLGIANGGKRVEVWNLLINEIFELGQHDGTVISMAFSPDGKYLLSGGSDNIVKLWSIENRSLIETYRGHSDKITSVAFSPDGNMVISGSSDSTIKIWDIQPPRKINKFFYLTDDNVQSVVFSPDANYLMSTKKDSVEFLNILTRQVELRYDYPSVWEAKFNKMGNYFAASSYDNTLKIWDLINNKLICRIDRGSSQAGLLALSPSGEQVLCCNANRDNIVYEVKTGKILFELDFQKLGFNCAIYTPDGNAIITSDWDGVIHIWNAKNGNKIDEYYGHTDAISDMILSSDGHTLVSASNDRTVRMWDLATGSEKNISPLMGHGGRVNCVAFNDDGTRLITGSSDRTIKILEADSGLELLTLTDHNAPVIAVKFTPDGQTLLSADSDGSVITWVTEAVNEY